MLNPEGPHVKLTDFGFATNIDIDEGRTTKLTLGNRRFMAPELLQAKLHD